MRQRPASTRVESPVSKSPDSASCLQDFVREILREQPENVYNFGARYFAELANPAVRMRTTPPRPPPLPCSPMCTAYTAVLE